VPYDLLIVSTLHCANLLWNLKPSWSPTDSRARPPVRSPSSTESAFEDVPGGRVIKFPVKASPENAPTPLAGVEAPSVQCHARDRYRIEKRERRYVWAR